MVKAFFYPNEKDSEPPVHMESVLLNQDEITEFLASYGDMEVRVCDSVLLLPLDKVYALLDIQIRSLWDSLREARKGLPTSKTALKHFSNDSGKFSRSAQEKFVRALPMCCCRCIFAPHAGNLLPLSRTPNSLLHFAFQTAGLGQHSVGTWVKNASAATYGFSSYRYRGSHLPRALPPVLRGVPRPGFSASIQLITLDQWDSA